LTHYITIPASPLCLFDDVTGEPLASEPTIEVGHAFRCLFRDRRIQEALSFPEVYDLRSRLMTATPGAVVQVSKDEHAALKAVLEKVPPFGPAFLFSPDGAGFLLAILNAPTKAPEAAP
jgi:hypothetical protein